MTPQNPTLMLNELTVFDGEAPPMAPFTRATEAWIWATEVLRRRRLPPTSPAWRDATPMTAAQRDIIKEETALNLPAEATHVADVWGGRFNPSLPQGAAERYALAQKIQSLVMALPPESAKLLQAWAWGDWADEARLRSALAIQEKARREGLRVCLSYRYSVLQLGQMLGCSKAQAWRKLRGALQLLEERMVASGLLEPPCKPAASQPTKAAPKAVRRAAFKL